MPKTIFMTEADLPKCKVCEEQHDKTVNAVFLAYIGIRIGSQEWQQWELVCDDHRHRYPSFRLVKHIDERRVDRRLSTQVSKITGTAGARQGRADGRRKKK